MLHARNAQKDREAAASNQRSARLARLRPRHHMPRALAQREKGAMLVDPQQPVIAGGIKIEHRGHRIGNPGIGDHRVDPPMLPHHLGKSGDHLGLLAHIHLVRCHPHAKGFQLGFGGSVLFRRPRPDRQIAALPGNAPRIAQPQPAVAAGDHRHLAGQIK